jgi:hypothetical protein
MNEEIISVPTLDGCREDVVQYQGSYWARSKKWADALHLWDEEQGRAAQIRDDDDRERAYERSDKRLLRARPKA